MKLWLGGRTVRWRAGVGEREGGVVLMPDQRSLEQAQGGVASDEYGQ